MVDITVSPPDPNDGEQRLLYKIAIRLWRWIYAGTESASVTLSTGTAAIGTVIIKGAPSLAVTKITALANGTATLAARTTRRSVEILCLDDSAETIYYGPTTGVNATTGARLKAGQSKVVDYAGALFFYGAAGTGTVQTVETYD